MKMISWVLSRLCLLMKMQTLQTVNTAPNVPIRGGGGKTFQSGGNWPKKGHPNFSKGTATLSEIMLALNLSSFSEND